MFFVSTRNAKTLSHFKDAVLNIIPDQQGGLFAPSFFTPMDFNKIYHLASNNYKDILIKILHIFSDGYLSEITLNKLLTDVFQNFNRGFGYIGRALKCYSDNIFTIQTLQDNLHVINLTHGPTGCCKDYGYCVAASIINHLSQQDGKTRAIIDVSNGISGLSSAWALKNKQYLKGFILLCTKQEPSLKALVAQADKEINNVYFTHVDADCNFIDQMQYSINKNNSLKEFTNLTFINEMNLLNILAYLPFFFKAYVRCNYKPFCVSVPTGNMSLGMAAFFAKKIGIPIKKIILATEKNDFFPTLQESKIAINKDQIETGCSSFTVNIPSNFERLLFYLYESNQASVKRTMEELEGSGRYKISDSLLAKFKEHFFVAECNNTFTIRQTIYSTIREKELYIEQHYALAKMGIDIAKSEIPNEVNNSPIVIFNTLDYRRNINFVNASLGYDLEHVQYPWTEADIKNFHTTEIKADITEIMRYIAAYFDNPEKFKKMEKEHQHDTQNNDENQQHK